MDFEAGFGAPSDIVRRAAGCCYKVCVMESLRKQNPWLHTISAWQTPGVSSFGRLGKAIRVGSLDRKYVSCR